MVDMHPDGLQDGRLRELGGQLAWVLTTGGRLLACGDDGTGASAQHLVAAIVGRFREDRIPVSAIVLHTDSSALPAVANDCGEEQTFTSGVREHGRRGDVLVAMSTGGTGRDAIAAAEAARDIGMLTWALTGPAPNALAAVCDESICVDAPSTGAVPEIHLMLVHGLCVALDDVLRWG